MIEYIVNDRKIKPMLTITDVAHMTNVHTNTVRRWSNRGVLRTYRIGSRGDRRFRIEDIYDFLRQNTKIAGKRDE
jgi:excisionase family DNA binding protein